MAKICMWETDNSAALSAGGGGSQDHLHAYRTLSQRIPTVEIGPQEGSGAPTGAPMDEAAATPAGDGGGGGGGGGAAAAGSAGGSAPAAAGSDPAGQKKTAKPSSLLSAAQSFKFTRKLSTGGPAGGAKGGGGGSGGDGSGSAGGWPHGTRLPPSFSSRTQPGALVATLRAHPEGVRQLVTSSDGATVYSRGRTSVVKAWSTQAVVDEIVQSPAAGHAIGRDETASALCLLPGDMYLGLGCSGSSEGSSLQLLAASRLGSPDASSLSLRLPTEEGAILHAACLGGDPSSTTLMYTTESGAVHGLDPRTGKAAWGLAHERSLGLLQTHAADASGVWMLLGSSTGSCILWDMRYRLRLNTWQTGGPPAAVATGGSRRRIHALLSTRAPGTTRPTVLVGSDGNLVSGWEIGEASPRCAFVLQPVDVPDADADTAAAASPGPSGGASTYAAGAGAPRSYAPAVAPAAAAAVPASQHSTRALLATRDAGCVVTASSDARLRCWRLQPDEAGRSFLLGGQPAEASDTSFDERRAPSGCRVLRERLAPPPLTTAAAAAAAGAPPRQPPSQRAASFGTADAGCAAAITSAVYCGAPQPGLLLAGSLDGTVRVWR